MSQEKDCFDHVVIKCFNFWHTGKTGLRTLRELKTQYPMMMGHTRTLRGRSTLRGPRKP